MALDTSEKRHRNKIASKKWRVSHPERALLRSRSNNRKLQERGWNQKYRRKLRMLVLVSYSDGTISCACCNEHEVKFLSIDHINGGGKQHRKEIKKDLYKWLIDNDFPDGYQVLCHNCNMAKGLYGACPHKKE